MDRSILGPDEFIRTNINGTFALLTEAKPYWESLGQGDKERFRFLHVSTDEVYGSLEEEDAPLCETTAYAPDSPYAASQGGLRPSGTRLLLHSRPARAYYQLFQ